MENISLHDLGINPEDSERVTNALGREGILDTDTLTGWSEDELLTIHNIGPKDIARINQALTVRGQSLRVGPRYYDE